MARINVEDQWWLDPRRDHLKELCGSESMADGVMLKCWRIAQDFWKKNQQGIPKSVFERLERSSKIIEAGLAVVRGDFVYIAGSEDNYSWLLARSEAGKRGGLKSQENSSSKRKQTQANASKSEQTQPSPSFSPSASCSKKEEKTNLADQISECLNEWKTTLESFSVQFVELGNTKPLIGSAIQRHGFEAVRMAIIGQRYQKSGKDFDPKQHLSLQKLFDPRKIESFINLASGHQQKEWKLASDSIQQD